MILGTTVKRLFIEASWFSERMKKIGSDELLTGIQDEILKNPSVGDLVQGTGGVRKMRMGNKTKRTGKSGGYRVLYLDLPDRLRTYLIFFYSKAEADDISTVGKKAIREMVKQIKEPEL